MENNKDLIKAVFDDDNIIKYNKWFFKADWEKANIVNLETKNDWLKVKYIIWYNGIWKDGIWKDGTWEDGYWEKGTWKNGTWENGTWRTGYWEEGIWKNGIWKGGVWKNGVWKNGTWRNGYWQDGTWKRGTWENGKIFDSKTKKYIESKVPPNECKWSSSYGK